MRRTLLLAIFFVGFFSGIDPASAAIPLTRHDHEWAERRQDFWGTPDEMVRRALGIFLATPIPERYFSQKLDHRDPSDARTFLQRYSLDSSLALGPDSPVIFYICGEAPCSSRSIAGGFVRRLAEKHDAHLVALEHRYYGKSQPFPDHRVENLKYLSTAAALEDLAVFQRYAMTTLGLRGRWIAVGGSYPGSLAAYYRLKHPDLVIGALASSAPVEARNSFVEYDGHMAHVLGAACSAKLREVSAAAEMELATSPAAARRFKKLFGAEEVLDDRDFLYVLADVSAYAVQYGEPKPLCDLLLAPGADVVSVYSTYVKKFLAEDMKQTAAEFSPQASLDPAIEASGGFRAWYYQSCTEYGYWQDAHPDRERSSRSAWIDSSYSRDFCNRAFGIEKLAETDAINQEYYAPLLNQVVSRVLFTNGSTDPWSQLSVTPERGNNVNPNTEALTIEGTAHCDDLHGDRPSDSTALRSARDRFIELSDAWLE